MGKDKGGREALPFPVQFFRASGAILQRGSVQCNCRSDSILSGHFSGDNILHIGKGAH